MPRSARRGVTLVLSAAAVAIASVFVVIPTAYASSASGKPAVYGGVPASGNPGVVAVAIKDGGVWTGRCSAAMWRPRLLITAAHCVTRAGSDKKVDALAVFAPGAPAIVRSDTGPQGGSTVKVLRWWTPKGYVNSATEVTANDIAVIELSADLAPAGFTRLATQFDIARWTAAQALVQHVGYGLTGPAQYTRNPFRVALPLTSYSPGSNRGDTFSTGQTADKGLCPGDSGSPVSRTEAAAEYLLGVEVGSNSPCQDVPAGDLANISTVAIGQLSLLNTALASAGYPTIPSAPESVTVSAVGASVSVRWQPPSISPGSVVGYEVINGSGSVVCKSTTTVCTIAGLPGGTHSFTVRSRNALDEGDAAPPTPLTTVAIG